MNHRQHGVTIGGRRFVTNEDGKFVPAPEPAPEPGGNNTPHETITDQDWDDA